MWEKVARGKNFHLILSWGENGHHLLSMLMGRAGRLTNSLGTQSGTVLQASLSARAKYRA